MLINPKIFVPSIIQWEDLQDFIALVKDAKKFGIDIIPDYTFNFMGIGGSGKNDLDYPSADIRAKDQ